MGKASSVSKFVETAVHLRKKATWDERKIQIYQWLERTKHQDRPIPGQIFLIHEEGEF